MEISLFKHLFHPFKSDGAELSNKEIKKATVAGLVGGIFLLVPGVIAFYSLSYYFKSKKVVKIDDSSPNSIKISTAVSNQQKKTLSSASSSSSSEIHLILNKKKFSKTPIPQDQEHSDELVDDSDKKNSEKEDKKALQKPLVKEIKAEEPKPSFTAETLNELAKKDLTQEEVLSIISRLGVEVKRSGVPLAAHLEELYKKNPAGYFQIVNQVVRTEDASIIREFLLDKARLEEFLETYQDVDLLFQESDSVAMNKSLLSAFIPYYKALFHTGMKAELEEPEEASKQAFLDLLHAQIFNQKLEIDENNFQDVIMLADKLDLKRLKDVGEAWLVKKCQHAEDRSALFDFASSYNLQRVTRALIKGDISRYVRGESLITIPAQEGQQSATLLMTPQASRIVRENESQILHSINAFDAEELFEFAQLHQLESVKDALVKRELGKYRRKTVTNSLLKKWSPHITSIEVLPSHNLDILFRDLPNVPIVNISHIDQNFIANLHLLQNLQMVNYKSAAKDFGDEDLAKVVEALQDGDAVAKLEPSLPYVLSKTRLDLHRWNISNSFTDVLPAKLQNLNVSGTQISDAALAHLPDSLVHLDLTGCQITGEGFKDLPESLRSLSYPPSRNFEVENLKLLPAGVEYLNISRTLVMNHNPDYFRNLPSTIQRLDASNYYAFEQSNIAELPRTLKALNLLDCRTLEFADTAAVAGFPPSLESLSFERVYSACFPALPQSLKHLKLGLFPDQDLKNLPPQIESIEMTWAGPPAQLTGLADHASLTSLKVPHHLDADNLANLPRSLKVLEFKGSKLHDSDLASLPSELEVLHLQDCKFLTESCLKFLPKHIKEVHISGPNIKINLNL